MPFAVGGEVRSESRVGRSESSDRSAACATH
jgi:hypothetical protein